MKYIGAIFIALTIASCQPSITEYPQKKLDKLATEYVQLGLAIGKYDGAFVDAYYGPDSLKPVKLVLDAFPKDSFLTQTKTLYQKIDGLTEKVDNHSLLNRVHFLLAQLKAFEMRINIFSGESPSFDEETRALYGVTVPNYSEEHFKKLLQRLEESLPGEGTIKEKYDAITKKFIIPKEKVDTVLRAAIAESRKRTLVHIPLPENETFKMELVNDKPWSGYNWYQGNYSSLIQINTDLPKYMQGAIDVGSHESYPGHHVFNMLLEKKLYNENGWIETSMYPLYSPQSLIAEGSANFGIEMIFPGEEKAKFCKEVLLPLAEMDTSGISKYFQVLALKEGLSYINNKVARGVINGTLTEEEGIQWLEKYGLRDRDSAEKYMSFVKTYRSYVINYTYGKDLVKNYIEANGGTPDNPEKRWELFTWLLSNQVLPADLNVE